VYARTNQYGFLETPYQARGQRAASPISHRLPVGDRGGRVRDRAGERGARTQGGDGSPDVLVSCRFQNEFTLMPRDRIKLHGREPKQIVSVAASLIPFLEHDERQPRAHGLEHAAPGGTDAAFRDPAGGYRMERPVAIDSGVTVVNRRGGTVDSVDASRIVVRGER